MRRWWDIIQKIKDKARYQERERCAKIARQAANTASCGDWRRIAYDIADTIQHTGGAGR